MTKRIVALVAVLTLVMTLFILPETACAIYEAYSNCSNGKPLNVRSGPGKNYRKLGEYKYREIVPIDHDLGNGWSEVVWGSVPGYVMTSLVSRTDPGPYNPNRNRNNKQNSSSQSTGSFDNRMFSNARIVTPFMVTTRGTRGSGSVNVRWAPSTKAKLLKTIDWGTQLQVIADLGDWYQVVEPTTGITGFAMKKFLPRE